MSGLSYLCGYGYGSNSDDSDEYVRPDTSKRLRLPVPDLSKVPTVSTDNHVDDPQQHGNRIRSFPHVRGNWATFVYVKLPEEEDLVTLVNKLQKVVLSIDETCQRCDDFHISLSRTVILKYHQIATFSQSLQTHLTDIGSFELAFDSVKVYCNEENTRTFIALKVFSNKYLSIITKKVDEILQDFKLPAFYDDASFHMSILWVNGDKKEELTSVLNSLNDLVLQEVEKTLKPIRIHKVNCKTGNKHFQYSLE